MRVKSFLAKITVESLHEMDASISAWMERNNIDPKMVKQTLGEEKGHDGRQPESVMVTSVWYEPSAE